ncbi:MAG: hypothetical protein ASARMPRED_003140 [Alectoria sarmentosa]|nr:MAG: hypothetical protein ASARMPRED_003140 [Alectoria sarmentosa]
MTPNSPPPSPVKNRGRPKGSLDSRKRKSNDQYSDNIHTKKSRKYALKVAHFFPLRAELRKWANADATARHYAKNKVMKTSTYLAASAEEKKMLEAQAIERCNYDRIVKGIHSQNLAYRLPEDQINVGLAPEDRINVVDCTVDGFVDEEASLHSRRDSRLRQMSFDDVVQSREMINRMREF